MDCQPKRMPWIDRCVNLRQWLPRPDPRRLIDLILPDQCRLCGKASQSGGYCADCAAKLPRHQRQCRVCGVPFAGVQVCGRCQIKPPPFVETIAPFRYASPLSDDIRGLKYRARMANGRDLGLLLARELAHRAGWLPEVLIPVPLHWKRQFRRGFNQSAEIAKPVSEALNIPVDLNLVERRVHTDPQVGLTPAQRRVNLLGAFRCPHGRMPGSAAIIDDVITSGSTVAELARVLRGAGVDRIAVWALVRV